MSRPPFAGWAELRVTGSLEADVIKAAMDTAEIPVMLSAEAAGDVMGLTVGPLSDVSIFVPEERLVEAQALLSDARPLDFPEGD